MEGGGEGNSKDLTSLVPLFGRVSSSMKADNISQKLSPLNKIREKHGGVPRHLKTPL